VEWYLMVERWSELLLLFWLRVIKAVGRDCSSVSSSLFCFLAISDLSALASTAETLGIYRHPPLPNSSLPASEKPDCAYTTLQSPPPSHPSNQIWTSSIYRGLVPAKNILEREFAINGAVVRSPLSSSSSLAHLGLVSLVVHDQ
jgi:hypothetical protein